MTTANWEQIKQEYEQGDSLRVLAARHGISKSTIHEHVMSGQWTRTNPGHIPDIGQPLPPTADALSIANAILTTLKDYVCRKDLELKDIKMISDALSACQKVILAAPPAPSSQSSYIAPELIAVMTSQEQDIVQKILCEAEQRLKQDEKITPMRRTG